MGDREDYADRSPSRRLWYGSVGFALLGLALAGATLASAAFALLPGLPSGNWLFAPVICGPYALVFAAARRAGAGGRGRATTQACGPVVLIAGCLLLAVALLDARERVRRGRPADLPGLTFASGPVFIAQWMAGGLALLVARSRR
jgi:hypothetical protein